MCEQAGFEVSPDSIGLLGAVIVDMQASFLPTERVEKGPFVAYERPRDVEWSKASNGPCCSSFQWKASHMCRLSVSEGVTPLIMHWLEV